MRRLRSLTALVLLALWLPVTLHCDLEVAGLVGADGDDCCAQEQTCADDGCTVIESGHYKSANGVVKVAAPALAVDLLACVDRLFARSPLAELRSMPPPPPESFARPQDWVSEWRFVRRQALPARAPDGWLA